MPVSVAYILGAIVALAATIVAFVMIVPEKKRDTLKNKFFVYLHDLFNFKSLWLEKIIKFLYVFETLACIGIGFFMLFSSNGYSWMGGTGLILIIGGPIATRILYEFIMLTILAVKNLIDINNKLVPQPGSTADKKAKEAAAPPAPPVFNQPVQPPYQQPVQPRPAQPAPPAQQPVQPRPGYNQPYTPPTNNQPPQYNNFQR